MRQTDARLRILGTVFHPHATSKGCARMLLRRATGLILVAPLVLLAGCGSAERQAPNAKVATKVAITKPKATINPGPTEAPSPTAAATSSSAPGPSGSASSTAPAVPNQVKTVSALNQFDPATLEIKVGDEVTWVSDGFHTVTGGDNGTPDPASPIGNTPLSAPGQTVKKKFDKPGTYKYFCQPHVSLGMKGEIVVK
jgi:plastocyanin